MGKLLRTVVPFALLSALVGCGTANTPYVAPTGGDTARLLFRSKVVQGFGYRVYTFDDPHVCAKPLLIGNGGASNAPDSSALPAGPLATLQYLGVDRARRSCRVTISFYPAPRHTYVLFSEQDSASCKIRLVDATDAENMRPTRAFSRRLQGGRCEPLTQVSRSTEESAGSSTQGGPQSARELDDFKDLLPSQ